MRNKFPAWLVLTVICVVAAMLLAATNLATKDVIAENARRQAMATLSALMPDASDFEETDGGITVGKDKDGNVVGYATTALTQGFGGEIETTVASKPDGTIGGISVGGSNFAETAGLGARAKEPEFQAQFAGKSVPVALTKDGGEIEALSGATITSRAVIKGVNQAAENIGAVAGFEVASTSTAEHVGENRYAATVPGYGGPVKVFLTLDENRSITEITIGDSQFNESPGLGALAREAEFQDQFIGKTIPLTMDDIDAISGATITSTAVVDAINMIQAGLDAGLADQPIVEVTEEAPAEQPKAEVNSSGDGKYNAAAQGFGGPVRVFLTLDESNTITAIEIGDNDFNETEYLGERALEPEFQQQFIGKTLPVTMDDIDGLTGATITTNAVLDAINQIAEAAGAGGAGSSETQTGTGDQAPAEEQTPAEEQAPAENLPTFGEDVSFIPGTYTGTGKGWADQEPVTVKITVDSRAITDAEIEGEGETPFGTEQFEKYAAALIGRRDGNIDAVTNATETRNGVREAVWNALEKAVMSDEVKFIPGTYEGTGKGWSDEIPVTVKLTVDEKSITAAVIEGAGEVPFGVEQMEKYAADLIGRRNGNIDAVTNATETRNGVQEAVWMALEKAIAP